MLNALVGRSRIEGAKSIAIAALTVLLAVSLWQVSAGQAQAQQEMRDRNAAAEIAGRFAVALTSYDYAHLDVQQRELRGVASNDVIAVITRSSGDVQAAKATSIGTVIRSWIVGFESAHADAIVRVSQVEDSTFVAAPTVQSSLLDVRIADTRGGWQVVGFEWLSIATLSN
jgi:hypothetical protein